MKTQFRFRSFKRQCGAEMVEFAIALPLMMLLFAGVVDFGLAFADKAVITDASRAAAREAIRGGADEEAREKADAVLASVKRWGAEGLYTCDPTRCPITRAGTSPGDVVTVNVKVPFQPLLLHWLLPEPIFKRFDLSGTTAMRMLLESGS
jgi:Flp pilus assembly protein TadG